MGQNNSTDVFGLIFTVKMNPQTPQTPNPHFFPDLPGFSVGNPQRPKAFHGMRVLHAEIARRLTRHLLGDLEI